MSDTRLSGQFQAPPGASPRARALARRVITPIQAFLQVQAASGLVLLAATALALLLANGPFAGAYRRALEFPLGVRLGDLVVERPLHFWIDDGLMTLFFFVVGLEIRREMHGGELANLRRAALPTIAAVGGMIAPALLYAAANRGAGPALRGWGVPMATDIAFAVGVLALLGPRVPPALRVLLLALAIIDDIGSILVIAVFYSTGIRADGLILAGGGVLAILVMQRFGVRRALLYVAPGFVVWLGILRSGVHPTIAGVIVGLLTPAVAWIGPHGLVGVAKDAAVRIERGLLEGEPGRIPSEDLHAEAGRLELARREALSPAERLQLQLHPWVAFGIMPVFALANAGVKIAGTGFSPGTISLGVVLGLVVGKPIGIVTVSVASARLGLCRLPRGIALRELLVLGTVAGIGFTMALFVAGLAFASPAELDEAKVAVLAASGLAGVVGLATGFALLPRGGASERRGEAASEAEAEASDET
jgi:NhaA family Na+:H+ antiporter